jgi:hypothetical protein
MGAKQKLLKSHIKSKKITYNWHEPKLSILESAISRGDRRMGRVILKAFELGCKFDGWGEHFKFEMWMKAFEETGLDIHFFTSRKRSYDEILPWDHIDSGVTKEFLISENERSKECDTTKNCREECSCCGVASAWGGVCNV